MLQETTAALEAAHTELNTLRASHPNAEGALAAAAEASGDAAGVESARAAAEAERARADAAEASLRDVGA
jgi:hypothetical protein